MCMAQNFPIRTCRASDAPVFQMTRVSSENEIRDFVHNARESRVPFEIVSGGTRRGAGKPMGEGKPLAVLDVSGVSGIVEYQPEELIVTARPGPASPNSRRPWHPATSAWASIRCDWTLFGANGNPTLGGAASADASGPGTAAPWARTGFASGLSCRQWIWRRLSRRRQGGEECHRLRPAENGMRRLRHFGGAE